MIKDIMTNHISSHLSVAATALTVIALTTSCQGDDFAAQQPDNYGEISFGVSMQQSKEVTRANTEGYRDWSADSDPTSLGVYGYVELSQENFKKTDNCIFDNTEIDYSATSVWTYKDETKKKYWFDYNHFKNFTFFGYMPYKSDATAGGDGSDGARLVNIEGTDSYTLSFPVEYTKPILTDDDKPSSYGLICNKPNYTNRTDQTIVFDMDQLMTGFKLQFSLGRDMDAVRDFKIKKVTISGTFPYKGTVSRTYTYDSNSDSWSSGNVTWQGLTTKEYTSEAPFVVFDKADEPLTLTSTAQTAGITFYAIPADFKPTIEVTYDVYTDGSTTIKTRQNVKNTIIFNPSNTGNPFQSNTALQTGTLTPIVINIVPDYLYVLADQDQAIGYLVIKQ